MVNWCLQNIAEGNWYEIVHIGIMCSITYSRAKEFRVEDVNYKTAHPVRKLLTFLIRILHFRKTFRKNRRILIKSAKTMYDLARSCQEFQEKS